MVYFQSHSEDEEMSYDSSGCESSEGSKKIRKDSEEKGALNGQDNQDNIKGNKKTKRAKSKKGANSNMADTSKGGKSAASPSNNKENAMEEASNQPSCSSGSPSTNGGGAAAVSHGETTSDSSTPPNRRRSYRGRLQESSDEETRPSTDRRTRVTSQTPQEADDFTSGEFIMKCLVAAKYYLSCPFVCICVDIQFIEISWFSNSLVI